MTEVVTLPLAVVATYRLTRVNEDGYIEKGYENLLLQSQTILQIQPLGLTTPQETRFLQAAKVAMMVVMMLGKQRMTEGVILDKL
jgi:hypothetical protein